MIYDKLLFCFKIRNFSYLNNNDRLQMRIYIKALFLQACTTGESEFVEFLYCLSTMNDYDKIIVNFDDDICFRTACANGHLEIVQWLYHIWKRDRDQNRINLNAKNNEAYILAKQNGHDHVLEWLDYWNYMEQKIRYQNYIKTIICIAIIIIFAILLKRIIN